TTLRDLRRFAEAETMYAELLSEQPEHPLAYRGLGQCARARSDQQAALAYFRRAAALSPKDMRLSLDVADSLRDLRRVEEAELAYKAILQVQAGNAAAHRGLGRCAWAQGRHHLALERFQAAAAPLQEILVFASALPTPCGSCDAASKRRRPIEGS